MTSTFGFKALQSELFPPRVVRQVSEEAVLDFLNTVDPTVDLVQDQKRSYFESSKGTFGFSAAPRGRNLNQVQINSGFNYILGLVGDKIFLAPTSKVSPYCSPQAPGYSVHLSFTCIQTHLSEYLFNVDTTSGYRKFKKFYKSL